jgi:hypothetical protein
MDGPMQETPAPEGVYRYRDLGAISQRWPATAAVVLADDPDELLARLSEAYLAQAQLHMRQVLVAAEVPVRALGWGWVHAGHGGLWGGGDRAHLPFGSVGWLLRTGHEDWLERAAELLPAASPRLGLFLPDTAGRESVFLSGPNGPAVHENDIQAALAAFCASVLDDFAAFAADYWASLRILMRDAGARGELVKPEVLPPERLGAPALWGAPWRALDGDDRAGFEAALHALERACSPLAFDVVSIGYHRLALGRGLWPDRAARR